MEGGKGHPLLSAHHSLGILQKALHTSPQLSLNSPPARLSALPTDAETRLRDPPVDTRPPLHPTHALAHVCPQRWEGCPRRAGAQW